MSFTSTTLIRKAELNDITAVQKLYSDQLKHHKPFDERWNLDWPNTVAARERLQHICHDSMRIMLVAENLNEIVGYLIGSIHTGHPASSASQIAELDSMHVLTACRRAGIGSKLIESFINICRSLSIDRVRLEVNSANQPTVEFYKAMGFGNYSSILIMDLK